MRFWPAERIPSMSGFSGRLKNILNSLIDRMAADPVPYVRNPSVDFTRSRKIAFATLLRLLLSMGGNSLNKELYDYFKPTGIETPTASAFVQQRNKLKPEACEHLFREFVKAYDDGLMLDGYRILAADSTVLTYDGYETDDTYRPKSCGWNQFQLHTLYDVLNKVYVDALIEPRTGQNEPKAAREMAARCQLSGKKLILCDRGYGGFNFIEHLNRTPDTDFLIRIKDNLWRELQEIPMTDIDTSITVNLITTTSREDRKLFASGKARHVNLKRTRRGKTTINWDFESPFEMKIRIVRFSIGENSFETIATSLPKDKFPLSRIRKLYRLRWGIETSFRELKYAVGLTSFHSKKRKFIIQEVFARLVMYNFCQRIIMSAVSRRKRKKWEWQANFTMGIHICRDLFRCRGSPDIERKLNRYILPIRPDRHDRRNMQAKGCVFFLYRVA